MTDDQRARALDAPFTPPVEWGWLPGRCSRCQQPARLGEVKWWHVGDDCRANGLGAEFLPDPM